MKERYFIQHCAPTLASMKAASLFWCPFMCDRELERDMRTWNKQFLQKGIRLYILKKQGNMALVYVCRIKMLQHNLQQPPVRRFLEAYGYPDTQVEEALKRLAQRLAEAPSFPHEIGIFLGYPLEDVAGFIHNGGKNCKCTGYWKVYCNESEARKTFAKFNQCRDVYTRLWNRGRTVMQLTVAA